MNKGEILLGWTGEHDGIRLDVPMLLRTRLLIQANSGGGKSWLLRRLAEQLFGKIPVLIIDPEGEFATLREKFGYVLVGKGGETPADLRSAKMVAHKLLELRASAVCDLYELKPQHRHAWVRTFLDGLIDAPKNLWRPTVIIVDEAHQYAPEGKSGESEASGAMVDLCTRGRKRGFCAIFATQRLGKLRKDAAAELLNVMIGMTFIDIDRERARECLGVSREERHAFDDQMKLLAEGKFFCLGRAICKERTLIKVGPVQTTHPEAGGGKFDMAPPPAPEAIQKMLPKLADLPKAAEEKAQTEAEYRSEIRKLKTELTLAKKMQPVVEKSRTEFKRVEVPILKDGQLVRAEKLCHRFANLGEIVMRSMSIVLEAIRKIEKSPSAAMKVATPRRLAAPLALTPVHDVKVPARIPNGKNDGADGEFVLRGGARTLLIAAAQHHPDGCTDEQFAVLSNYRKTSRSTFKQQLMSAGYITRGGVGYIATETGIAALGSDYEPLPIGDELREHWLRTLTGGELELFKVYLERGSAEVSNEEMGTLVAYKKTSIGTFRQKLCARRLIVSTRGGAKLAPELF